jgi:hypothetical protein
MLCARAKKTTEPNNSIERDGVETQERHLRILTRTRGGGGTSPVLRGASA